MEAQVIFRGERIDVVAKVTNLSHHIWEKVNLLSMELLYLLYPRRPAFGRYSARPSCKKVSVRFTFLRALEDFEAWRDMSLIWRTSTAKARGILTSAAQAL